MRSYISTHSWCLAALLLPLRRHQKCCTPPPPRAFNFPQSNLQPRWNSWALRRVEAASHSWIWDQGKCLQNVYLQLSKGGEIPLHRMLSVITWMQDPLAMFNPKMKAKIREAMKAEQAARLYPPPPPRPPLLQTSVLYYKAATTGQESYISSVEGM